MSELNLNAELDRMAEMSDEDFLKEDFDTTPEPEHEEVLDEDTDLDNTPVNEEVNVDEDSTEEEEETTTEPEENTEGMEQEEVDVDKTDDASDVSDFEQRITSPFKANGKMMQVNNADEAIKLMQMGANYNKKMTGMKDNLKRIKMLEQNGLLDDDKLSYLIDLSKKDKGAITKLLKDAELDPLDLDLDEDGTEYSPNTYTVNDEQMALDDVISELRDTDGFGKTVDIVGNMWDKTSRDEIGKNPNYLRVINDHVNSGVYDKITEVVEQQRMLGNLQGLSDVRAYEAVGAQLYPMGQPTEASPVSNVEVKRPVIKKEDPALQRKKKALSSTKTRKPKNVVEDDLSNLSDEDFLKATAYMA